ncbi:TraB/GumN family protein [[Pseudomonas] boreopolis]|uniref:TraB/GumN family protein n=1 Tax=Xanthomonas boreopolis TaxID=86183 RepID=UPI003D5A150D
MLISRAGMCFPLVLAFVLVPFSASARQDSAETQSATQTSPGIVDMASMVVRGAQPGPGLWKVTKGDHVLWILGTLAPLPDDIEWQPKQVESVIAQSQQVLLTPSVKFDVDMGFWGKLTLLPSLMKAKKNEGGADLAQVVPAEAYKRWLVLKQHYLGNNTSVEKKRPMLAGQELYNEAIKKSGLGNKAVIWPVVSAASKRAGIEPTSTQLLVQLTDARAAVKQFSRDGMDDRACFASQIDAVEYDLAFMVNRANAWALGDIGQLTSLPHADPQVVCMQAFLDSTVIKQRGYGDLYEKLRQHWMAFADKALDTNSSTFALLPVDELLKPNGYLDRLRAQGYEIEAP